ncbi:MAG: hypothetical protein II776_03565 [Clostridia bacterium]|nr:hypothetical protein [Clostridia bacterium]
MSKKAEAPEALFGAWEEPGVIGTRVEIDRECAVVLWRGAVVLNSPYILRKEGEALRLVLRKTGLRYPRAASDHGSLTGLVFTGDSLRVTKCFPVTGESEEILRKTDHTRFGNFAEAPEILPLLAGGWTDGDYLRLTVEKGCAVLDGERHPATVLRSLSDGRLFLADKDPTVTEWRGLDRFEILMHSVTPSSKDLLSSRIFVCDAPSIPVILRRVDSDSK